MTRPIHGPGSLTPKEAEYIQAIIDHGSSGYAAKALGVNPKTIYEAVMRVTAKLDCDTTLQAAVLFDRWMRERSGERRVGERRVRDRRAA